jgi:hypothetical protein
MLGLAIEVGIRTAVWATVWVVTSSCKGIYRLCFGSAKPLDDRVKLLEARIAALEKE